MYAILFKEQIDVFPFIGFLGFSINRMLYLLFPKRMWEKYDT
jgi:hypothetical protein